LVGRIRFDNAFIFKYSQRRDTPAAEMENQLPDSVKEDRNQDLLALVNECAREKCDALVGQRVEILCEGPSRTNEQRLMGRSPGNKIVIFDGSPRHIGEIFDVQIEHSSGFSVYGTPAVL
jgi:tRNA-2-methylthio-N6-dimethylallyladenosine synthase